MWASVLFGLPVVGVFLDEVFWSGDAEGGVEYSSFEDLDVDAFGAESFCVHVELFAFAEGYGCCGHGFLGLRYLGFLGLRYLGFVCGESRRYPIPVSVM